VDDLLDISRVSEGKLEMKLEQVELTLVLRQASEGVRGMLEAAGHTFVVDLPVQALYVDADPGRLIQIIENLLTEARQLRYFARHAPIGIVQKRILPALR
jgi:signal transduction histidine kinase